MKTILAIVAAGALLGLAGTVSAQTADPHAGHNHGAAPAAAPAPAPTPSPAASAPADGKGCDHPMPMAGMSGMQGMGAMQGKDGKPMSHEHMADCKMECCQHMMQGGTMQAPAPAPNPSPSAKP